MKIPSLLLLFSLSLTACGGVPPEIDTPPENTSQVREYFEEFPPIIEDYDGPIYTLPAPYKFTRAAFGNAIAPANTNSLELAFIDEAGKYLYLTIIDDPELSLQMACVGCLAGGEASFPYSYNGEGDKYDIYFERDDYIINFYYDEGAVEGLPGAIELLEKLEEI